MESDNRVPETWREVYDCKVAGMVKAACRDLAMKAGYGYYCHNEQIYRASDGSPVKISRVMTAIDITG